VQGVVAVKLVLEEGFFDATCPNTFRKRKKLFFLAKMLF
jgi:hypothetical protein